MGKYRKECQVCEGKGWVIAMILPSRKSEWFRVCLSCFGTGWVYSMPSFESRDERAALDEEQEGRLSGEGYGFPAQEE